LQETVVDFSAFRNSQVLILFAAQLISQLCDKLMLVGVMWAISERHSPEWAPWFVAVGALPHLLLSGIVPRWINRFGALRVVIATDIIRGGLLLGTVPILAGLERSDLQLIALFALNLSVNVLASLFNPAILVLPTRITRDQALAGKATALIETCFSLSAVLAPMLSVAAYAAFGLTGLLAVNGFSYLVAGGLEFCIRESKTSPEGEQHSQSESGAPGLMTIGRRDPLMPLLLGSFLVMNLFLGPVLAFIPLFARHIYQGGIGTVGSLETALGVGTLCGSFALALVLSKPASMTRIGGFLGAVAVSYVGFSLSSEMIAGAVSLGSLGLMLAIANVLIMSVFQSRAQSNELPTVMSWVNLISVASLPISMGITGLLLDRMGEHHLRSIAIVASLFCALTVGLFLVAAKALEASAMRKNAIERTKISRPTISLVKEI
jgi:MFS family permease